jgi:hypothetical protein
MITNHDDFEVLCAVAASGHLTRGERAELAEHVRHCVCCEKRLIEMRQLAIHLLLAQRFRAPGKHVQKGMQERFAERAIREGIPLSPRPQGIGFGSLSMVSTLLAVLLLVTATLKDGTFRRPVLETEVANTAANTADGVAIVNHRENSAAGVANDPLPVRERTSRVVNHRFHPDHGVSSVAIRAAAAEPEALHGRQFTFIPYSRNTGMRAYPLSTTIRPPEVVPALTFSYLAPGLTLDASSEVFTHGAPRLLAISERDSIDTFHFRSNLALQKLPGSSDVYQTTLKANFKDNAFQLIHNFFPEPASQERSQ